jgi:hypothetical protein
LLNPKGTHFKGDLYLRLFWKIVVDKLGHGITLDTANANVKTEDCTAQGRRIDIGINDGNVFIPIEVKINAGEQKDQIKDYAKESKYRNDGKPIPVLFLTLDGRKSETADSEDDYVSISFQEDILAWLEKCLNADETKDTPPVCEVIKQLIEAVKSISISGYTEDTEMDDAILKQITKDDYSVRAALAISGAMGLLKPSINEAFKGQITDLVQKSFPDAEYEVETEDDSWHSICIPIRNEEYLLYVNYDWKAMTVQPSESKRDSATEKKLSQKMMALTGYGGNDWDGTIVWAANDKKFCYPTLVSVDESLYFYRLYKLYTERPQEVADEIIRIARELESVVA